MPAPARTPYRLLNTAGISLPNCTSLITLLSRSLSRGVYKKIGAQRWAPIRHLTKSLRRKRRYVPARLVNRLSCSCATQATSGSAVFASRSSSRTVSGEAAPI